MVSRSVFIFLVIACFAKPNNSNAGFAKYRVNHPVIVKIGSFPNTTVTFHKQEEPTCTTEPETQAEIIEYKSHHISKNGREISNLTHYREEHIISVGGKVKNSSSVYKKEEFSEKGHINIEKNFVNHTFVKVTETPVPKTFMGKVKLFFSRLHRSDPKDPLFKEEFIKYGDAEYCLLDLNALERRVIKDILIKYRPAKYTTCIKYCDCNDSDT